MELEGTQNILYFSRLYTYNKLNIFKYQIPKLFRSYESFLFFFLVADDTTPYKHRKIDKPFNCQSILPSYKTILN